MCAPGGTSGRCRPSSPAQTPGLCRARSAAGPPRSSCGLSASSPGGSPAGISDRSAKHGFKNIVLSFRSSARRRTAAFSCMCVYLSAVDSDHVVAAVYGKRGNFLHNLLHLWNDELPGQNCLKEAETTSDTRMNTWLRGPEIQGGFVRKLFAQNTI